jgi:hypothetical protein
MSEKLAVNFVGHPFVGVRTACNYVEALGFDVVRPRKIIEESARKNSTFLNSRSDYQAATKQMLENDSRAFIQPVMDSPNRFVAIEGLQIPRDIRSLRVTPGIREVDVAIICPEHVRYDRAMQQRHIARKPLLNYEEFMADEYVDYFNWSEESETVSDDSATNVLEIMHEADLAGYTILNSGISKLEFGKQISRVLSRISPEDFPSAP